MKRRNTWVGAAVLLAILLLFPGHGRGQIVPVKTVPVASGDQFLLFPSSHLAMGGVGLAMPDTLGGGFVNPALGSRLREGVVFGSPTYYGVSDRNGSGRSLPVGSLFLSGDWFGGGALALQELDGQDRERWLSWDISSFQRPEPLSEGSARNLYAFGMVGKRFPESGISLGVSGFWADLRAVEGVDLLYAGSDRIRQSGTLSDLRLGLEKVWAGGGTLEVLLLKSRLRMRHEVDYLEWVWIPMGPGVEPMGDWAIREETNLDHTDTWGVHLAYHRPLKAPGWRVGWSLTGNWRDHPKIPNYEIQNIPRDPGKTRAFSGGIGISRTRGPFRIGMDVFLEPIHSDSWALAERDTTRLDLSILPAGARTVENEFDFTNALIRLGGSWERGRTVLQAGLQVRSISYELEQFNHYLRQRRVQEESWMEWTPTLGIRVDLEEAVLDYALLITTGTGQPGVQWFPEASSFSALDSAAAFLLAPSGPLSLQEARVTRHQLSVVIPIG